MPGKLYIVALPIGNYQDITHRALETLKSADFIACEDTRVTRRILNEFSIEKQLFSYHDHNAEYKATIILEKLQNGENIALVSDAGTPGINDPGYKVVKLCRENEIEVIGVPGACAAINALVTSGLPTDRFLYYGFLPHKKGRKTALKELSKETVTVILYESVHRIEKLLNELMELLPEREISIHREMTKTFESVYRGTPSRVIELLPEAEIKGEFVVIIAPEKKKKKIKVNKYKTSED